MKNGLNQKPENDLELSSSAEGRLPKVSPPGSDWPYGRLYPYFLALTPSSETGAGDRGPASGPVGPFLESTNDSPSKSMTSIATSMSRDGDLQWEPQFYC